MENKKDQLVYFFSWLFVPASLHLVIWTSGLKSLQYITGLILYFAVLALFFSFITFFVKKETFLLWRNFTSIYFIIYLPVMVFSFLEDKGQIGGMGVNITISIVAILFLFFTYSLISLIIILYSIFKKSKIPQVGSGR